MDIAPLESLTPGSYQLLARELRDLPIANRGVKLVLLSSNSFSFLEPYLLVECARRNLAVTPWVAPFGQVEQSILAAESAFGTDETIFVVIALRIEDVFPDAFSRRNTERLAAHASHCIGRLESCIKLIRERSRATIFIANFAVPGIASRADIYDGSRIGGIAQIVGSANADISARFESTPDVFIWDYAGLVQSRGASSWTDNRLWNLARQPISGVNLPHAASHLARSIAGTVFQRAKCLVLDLDNTLWGGVAGEDGVSGVKIGDDYPGNMFKAFQQAVLSLKDRGVLLAISSKNDEDLIKQVFEEHPDLVVRWDDFSSIRVNWNAKSGNIRSIAADLNIGLDSIVFFDDNPVEREEVRQNLPEVNVIEVPNSSVNYVDALFESGLFDMASFSEEDAVRSVFYKDEERRQVLRKKASSVDEFLDGLEMEVSSGSVGPATIARVSQLIGKTNQFNLTTRRYSQSEIHAMVHDDSLDVRWHRLIDRYGDSGIIGVVIMRFAGCDAVIDVFLMSCRVMNRRVEFAMLHDAVDQAIVRGCTTVVGQYIATDRNSTVRDFYEIAGFSKIGGKAGEAFRLDIRDVAGLPQWPSVRRRSQIIAGGEAV